MNFRWIKPGTPVIAPPKAPDEAPVAGVIVPPATDIALRTAHSTWQGGIASLVVTTLLPLVGVHLSVGFQATLIAVLTGLLAFGRSWLDHRRQAKALPVP